MNEGPITVESDPLVSAKLVAPSLPRHVFARPRLLPSTEISGELRLCTIVAPAGFGKTIAAHQIADELATDYAWVSLEPAENDSSRFLRYLHAAIGMDFSAPAPIGSELDAMIGLSHDRALDRAFDRLRAGFDELDRRTVLVLDGLGTIHESRILSAIAEWMTVPSPNLVLICTATTNLELPVDKLRSQGCLHELGPTDLRFDETESAQMFAALGAEDPPSSDGRRTSEATCQHARGWPALVYLAAFAAATDRSDADDMVDAFLQTEGRRGLSDDQLDFLEATCVVDRLTPALCSALVDTPNTAPMLVDLERAGIVSREHGGESDDRVHDQSPLRVHPLLQSSLRRRVESAQPTRFRHQLRVAADHLDEMGLVDEALGCAINAGDASLGQRIIMRNWSTIMNATNFGAVRQWAQAVGPDGTAGGVVSLLIGWGELRHGTYEAMHEWLSRAERHSAGTEHEPLVQATRHIVLAEWHNRTGNIAMQLEHAETALQLSGAPAGTRFGDSRISALQGSARCCFGMAQLMGGNLDASRDSLMASAAASREPSVRQTLVLALSWLSLLEALAGNPQTALVYSDEAIRFMDTYDVDRRPYLPHLARSMVFLDRSDEAQARHELAIVDEMVDPAIEPIQRGLVEVQRARVEHRRGAIDQARRALGRARNLRTATATVLDTTIRAVENELRFVALGSNEELPAQARDLTERELEIAAFLPSSLTRSEIAEQLHISENTVKTHLTSIGRKLEARGRSAMVERLRELSIVT